MRDVASGDVLARLSQFGVHFDMDRRRPAPLPDALRGAALGRWQREAQRMRLVFLCSSANWVVHNTLVGTPFGLTSDALSLSTILIGLYRNRRRSPGQALRAAISALAERLAPGRAHHAPALSRLA
jgi:hypothetical protein